jgi:hypothetical protein
MLPEKLTHPTGRCRQTARQVAGPEHHWDCFLPGVLTVRPGMNGAIVVGQAAVRPATAPTPAALASASTASGGVDFGLLALGSLGGAVLGAVGTRWLRPGLSHHRD